MRKGCKRKVWQVQAIPLTFSMRQSDLNKAGLLARKSLDVLLSSEANEDDVVALRSVARFCSAMVARLVADATIDREPGAVAAEVAATGLAAIESVISRMGATGKIGCSGLERQQLVALLDLSDEIDKVATRRQSRDIVEQVFGDMFAPTSKPIQK
jgi:hypothetical protein